VAACHLSHFNSLHSFESHLIIFLAHHEVLCGHHLSGENSVYLLNVHVFLSLDRLTQALSLIEVKPSDNFVFPSILDVVLSISKTLVDLIKFKQRGGSVKLSLSV